MLAQATSFKHALIPLLFNTVDIYRSIYVGHERKLWIDLLVGNQFGSSACARAVACKVADEVYV